MKYYEFLNFFVKTKFMMSFQDIYMYIRDKKKHAV